MEIRREIQYVPAKKPNLVQRRNSMVVCCVWTYASFVNLNFCLSCQHEAWEDAFHGI